MSAAVTRLWNCVTILTLKYRKYFYLLVFLILSFSSCRSSFLYKSITEKKMKHHRYSINIRSRFHCGWNSLSIKLYDVEEQLRFPQRSWSKNYEVFKHTGVDISLPTITMPITSTDTLVMGNLNVYCFASISTNYSLFSITVVYLWRIEQILLKICFLLWYLFRVWNDCGI